VGTSQVIFKKKKKLDKLSSINNMLDVKNKIREFFLDTQSPDANQMALILGCVPISDEVMEREEEESDKRIERIAYLFPLIDSYSDLFSQAYIRVNLSDAEALPAEMQEHFHELQSQSRLAIEEAFNQILMGAITQVVDLSLLEVPKGRK
jgi:hypothetical protein